MTGPGDDPVLLSAQSTNMPSPNCPVPWPGREHTCTCAHTPSQGQVATEGAGNHVETSPRPQPPWSATLMEGASSGHLKDAGSRYPGGTEALF